MNHNHHRTNRKDYRGCVTSILSSWNTAILIRWCIHTHTHITESVRMSASPCVRQGVPHEAWERRVLFIFDLFIHIFYSYLICFILTEVYSYLILI